MLFVSLTMYPIDFHYENATQLFPLHYGDIVVTNRSIEKLHINFPLVRITLFLTQYLIAID